MMTGLNTHIHDRYLARGERRAERWSIPARTHFVEQ
jgi:hypothetical protein